MKYFIVGYISCEGNDRWFVAKTPLAWETEDLRDNLVLGGVGDDIAEIVSIEETYEQDYTQDFTYNGL